MSDDIPAEKLARLPGLARLLIQVEDGGTPVANSYDTVAAERSLDLGVQRSQLRSAVRIGQQGCPGTRSSHVAPMVGPCPDCGAAL